jgi:putative endonuclease
MIFVYILQSLIDKGFYIGITANVEKRLNKHNNGGVISTSKRKPFKVIYFEPYENYFFARLREKELKSFKGGNKLKELIA